MATSQQKDLKLNSPAGAEAFRYSWPLQTGSGADKHDGGIDIIDTIRWVCDDLPEIKTSFDDLNETDTSSYDSMKELCDRYNKAIDSINALVIAEL